MTDLPQQIKLGLFALILAFTQTFVINTVTDFFIADSNWLITFPLSLILAVVSVVIYKQGHVKDTPAINKSYNIISHWWGLLFNLFFASILYYPVLLFTGQPYIAGLALVGAIILYVYGINRAKDIAVKKLDLEYKDHKIENTNKIIGFISDLHLGKILDENFVKTIVSHLDDEKIDYLLIGGDMFDSVETNWHKVLAPLKEFAARVPTYYVTGNHDYYVDFETKLRPAIKAAGINLLESGSVELDSVVIHGIPHHLSESDFDFYKQFKKLEINDNKLNILLYHEPTPKHSRYALLNGINLQLSGHTHYGQMAPMNIVSWIFYGNFNYGSFYDEANDAYQYTSSGIGSWGPPVRTTAKPEIILLEI